MERISYTIDGIAVSDFLTPSYFTIGDAQGTRNDFLGIGVPSFGVTPNSHIAFFDLMTGTFETAFGQRAPAMAITGLRQRSAYRDHPKAERPDEERLEALLTDYKAKNPQPSLTGLPRLQGISRTGGYNARAESLVARMKVGVGV